MAKINFSTKRLQIDKANTTVVAVTAIAAFVTMFSLVSAKALLSQHSFQNMVIAEKEKAAAQLEANIKAVDSLKNSYAAFTSQEPNAIDGSLSGDGEKDGNNAKLVLDALPKTYDFPGLLASVEKELVKNNFGINAITGTDDEVAQKGNVSSPKPTPIDMPFQTTVTGDFNRLRSVVEVFELSIRPFHISNLSLSGSDNSIQMSLKAKSYWQPGKNLTITTKEVQ